MDNDVKTWLYDVLNAINEIDSFFMDRPKDFERYQSDLRTKGAVERNVEIVGEAIGRVLKQNDTLPITNSRRIVDLRNRIIHGYDSVSDEIIWSVVAKHLPILQAEIKQLLNE